MKKIQLHDDAAVVFYFNYLNFFFSLTLFKINILFLESPINLLSDFSIHTLKLLNCDAISLKIILSLLSG